jgi:TonB-linked SusC/RagA family outer membrane protein
MTRRLFSTLLAGAAALALGAIVPASVSAQSPTVVSGRVLGTTQAPIATAVIQVEGTQISTQSDAEGRYSLTIPATRTGPVKVVVRRIGFEAQKQELNATGAPIQLNWTMTPAATQLTGVVVTALSIQREKSSIGTSQQGLTSDDITRTKSLNLVSAMSGKVSGVAIQQNGNMGGSARVVIRGAGSILGENQPLFIVDGVPVLNSNFSTASASGGRDYGTGIADLNLDDIASMTVLKGPNAAALYGSRASNGAIVISTKTGRDAPSGTQVTFTSRMSSDQLSIFPKYQNKYGQGFGGAFQYVDGQGSGINDGADESWGPRLDGQLIDQFHGLNQPWIAHPDNVRDYFQTGSTISNNISIATSGDNMGARLSVTKDNIRGIVPNSSMAKLAGALSATATMKEKLTFSGSVQYTQSSAINRAENGYTEGNPWMTFTWFGRQVDVASLKNKYFNCASGPKCSGQASPYGFADGSLYNWNDNYHRNPWWQQTDNPAPDSRDRIIGQISANYQFTPWLTGLVRAGGDSYRNTREEHFAKGNIDRANPSYNGGFTVNNSRAKETNFEGILTAQRSWGMFDLTTNLGANRRRNDSDNNGYGTSGILVPGIYNLSNAGIAATFTNSEFHSGVNSAYGSAVVGINKYWTVEVTGRNDWSSTLPKENSSYFYPSVNSALVVTDVLPGLTSGGMLTYLKVRGGWVKVGSDAAPYQLQTLYNGSSSKFGSLALYSLSNTSANSQLKPEQTTGTEGGVEFSLFDDRIMVDATMYSKKTRDQIINLTIAPATGFSATAINAGQISNKGIEAMISAVPLKRANGVQWTTTFNYAKNTSKVDELAEGLTTQIITGGQQWGANIEARLGQPYGVLFGTGYLRDTVTGSPTNGQLLLTAGGLPQRDPVKKILGNVNPDWVGGWLNDVRYKNYALSVLVDFRRGGQNFSIGNWWGMYAGVLESTLEGREVDWDDPGIVVKGKNAGTGLPNTVAVTAEDYNHTVYPIHEAAVYNTGFTKLREVRLSWDAPASIASRLRLSQLNVAFVGRNLLTWTDFPNFDPENSTNATNAGQGFDMGAMPTTRTFGLNFTLTP